MMTAQDQLRSMLRDDVAPVLRAAGLRGTERKFVVPDAEWFAQIGVQTSTSSTSELSILTLNVQLIPKVMWKELREARHFPATPSPNTEYGRVGEFWQVRAGELIDGQDRWWTLDARGSSRRALAVELSDLIIDIIVPALRSRMAVGERPLERIAEDGVALQEHGLR